MSEAYVSPSQIINQILAAQDQTERRFALTTLIHENGLALVLGLIEAGFDAEAGRILMQCTSADELEAAQLQLRAVKESMLAYRRILEDWTDGKDESFFGLTRVKSRGRGNQSDELSSEIHNVAG